MRINNKTMVDKISEATDDISKEQITAVLAAEKEVINTSLLNNDSVVFHGIGTFSLMDIAKRTYRNVRTGADVLKPATKRLKFKYSAGFRKNITETFSK